MTYEERLAEKRRIQAALQADPEAQAARSVSRNNTWKVLAGLWGAGFPAVLAGGGVAVFGWLLVIAGCALAAVWVWAEVVGGSRRAKTSLGPPTGH